MDSLVTHLRSNAVAYLALFVALGGSAYAAATIGSDDIRRNAVRSKHIASGQVTNADANARSLGASFGSGLLGGEVMDFQAGGGSSFSRPLAPFGRDHLDGADQFGLLAPRNMTVRDLRFSTSDGSPPPSGRVVRFELEIRDEILGNELACELNSMRSSCMSGATRLPLPAGKVLEAQISTPLSGTALPSEDYVFAYRVVP